LPSSVNESLVTFLQCNEDIFAWSHEDLLGIDPSVLVHRLNIGPSHRPVKQKRISFAPERNQEISKEVEKLLQAGFIQKVDYPTSWQMLC
jgi:hypothetical protein